MSSVFLCVVCRFVCPLLFIMLAVCFFFVVLLSFLRVRMLVLCAFVGVAVICSIICLCVFFCLVWFLLLLLLFGMLVGACYIVVCVFCFECFLC